MTTDQPVLCLIAAVTENFAIGKDGDLLFELPDDLKFFRQKTRGNVCIMGRKTLESLPDACRPLPNRPNIVISRHDPLFEHPLVTWVDNVATALETGRKMAMEKNQNEYFVIGGGAIYTEALPKAHRLYLTQIEAKADGDAFFPEFDDAEWSKVMIMDISKSDTAPGFKTYQYDRITPLR